MLARCLGRSLYLVAVILWLFAALSAVAQPAYAYVDPGSGLLIVQIISSTFVGITFLIRKRIREIFWRIGRSHKKAGESVEPH